MHADKQITCYISLVTVIQQARHMSPINPPPLQNNTAALKNTSSSPNTIISGRAYPALREWEKHLKTPDEIIDRMIIAARKEGAPMYAVKKQTNGRWCTLSLNTPYDVEAFFKIYHPLMFELARK